MKHWEAPSNPRNLTPQRSEEVGVAGQRAPRPTRDHQKGRQSEETNDRKFQEKGEKSKNPGQSRSQTQNQHHHHQKYQPFKKERHMTTSHTPHTTGIPPEPNPKQTQARHTKPLTTTQRLPRPTKDRKYPHTPHTAGIPPKPNLEQTQIRHTKTLITTQKRSRYKDDKERPYRPTTTGISPKTTLRQTQKRNILTHHLTRLKTQL